MMFCEHSAAVPHAKAITIARHKRFIIMLSLAFTFFAVAGAFLAALAIFSALATFTLAVTR